MAAERYPPYLGPEIFFRKQVRHELNVASPKDMGDLCFYLRSLRNFGRRGLDFGVADRCACGRAGVPEGGKTLHRTRERI